MGFTFCSTVQQLCTCPLCIRIMWLTPGFNVGDNKKFLSPCVIKHIRLQYVMQRQTKTKYTSPIPIPYKDVPGHRCQNAYLSLLYFLSILCLLTYQWGNSWFTGRSQVYLAKRSLFCTCNVEISVFVRQTFQHLVWYIVIN